MLCVAAIAAAQSFVVLEKGGIRFRHQNSPTSQKYLLETMGGGVAMVDFDNDGRLDLFFVNGGRLADPQKTPADFQRQNPLYWNRLYRQNADGSFVDVTQAAGLSGGPNHYGMGVAVGDYDNDGFADLYVTGYPVNVMYHNKGNGSFEAVESAAVGGWSASAGFFDYDRDGRLDLFVTRYLDWDISRNMLCGTPYLAYCRPDKFGTVSNVLLHNEGGGRFKDVSMETGIGAVKGKGLGVGFGDFDGDGFIDVFVANDGMEQFLFRNEGGRKFREKGVEAGVAFSDDGKSFAGMGVAVADYDRDGLMDIVVTNLALEKYALYRNEGGGQFRYASLSSGLAGLTVRSSGWGVAMEDFDNDGWRDLFVAQSHVLDNVERMNSGLRYLEPPMLLIGGRGKFRKVGFEVAAVAGRGLAWGDLDNDGRLDVVVCTLGGGPLVFYNRSEKQHWLTIQVRGRASNRDGAGARVRVGGQTGVASRAGSYLSASDGRVHFGLGSGASGGVKVEILWPGGRTQVLEHVDIDRVLMVEEPQ